MKQVPWTFITNPFLWRSLGKEDSTRQNFPMWVWHCFKCCPPGCSIGSFVVDLVIPVVGSFRLMFLCCLNTGPTWSQIHDYTELTSSRMPPGSGRGHFWIGLMHHAWGLGKIAQKSREGLHTGGRGGGGTSIWIIKKKRMYKLMYDVW